MAVQYSYQHTSRKFCCLYVCATNISNAVGCIECSHWVGFFDLVALSKLTPHSAVLASFLLNEELGHLGRTGCALCLIGSLIIVLHAPPDKEIETVDEILHYAIQPGKPTLGSLDRALIRRRFYVVLPYCLHLLVGHDFQRCTSLRPLNPSGLHFHMFFGRLCICHGHQRIWRRCQTHLGWK